MQKTSIEWTNYSANALKLQLPNGALVNACVHKSEGCRNCYAETLTRRWWKREWGEFPGYTPALLKLGRPVLVEKELEAVLRLSERIVRGKADPSENKIFWHDMTDEYLEFWPDEMLDKIWAVRALTPNLIHQVLTKRPERMSQYFDSTGATSPTGFGCPRINHILNVADRIGRGAWPEVFNALYNRVVNGLSSEAGDYRRYLPNVHLGVSCENQQTADARIPWLLKTPAAVRWVSYEPALGPVRFDWLGPDGSPSAGLNALTGEQRGPHEFPDDSTWGESISWLICGGESGPGARPFDIQWARDTIAQCRAAGVKVFCKQLGRLLVVHPFTDSWDIASPRFGEKIAEGTVVRLKDKKGSSMEEWPEDLRVREFPICLNEPNQTK